MGKGAAGALLVLEIRVCHDHARGSSVLPQRRLWSRRSGWKVDRPLHCSTFPASTDAASPPISVPAPTVSDSNELRRPGSCFSNRRGSVACRGFEIPRRHFQEVSGQDPGGLGWFRAVWSSAAAVSCSPSMTATLILTVSSLGNRTGALDGRGVTSTTGRPAIRRRCRGENGRRPHRGPGRHCVPRGWTSRCTGTEFPTRTTRSPARRRSGPGSAVVIGPATWSRDGADFPEPLTTPVSMGLHCPGQIRRPWPNVLSDPNPIAWWNLGENGRRRTSSARSPRTLLGGTRVESDTPSSWWAKAHL